MAEVTCTACEALCSVDDSGEPPKRRIACRSSSEACSDKCWMRRFDPELAKSALDVLHRGKGLRRLGGVEDQRNLLFGALDAISKGPLHIRTHLKDIGAEKRQKLSAVAPTPIKKIVDPQIIDLDDRLIEPQLPVNYPDGLSEPILDGLRRYEDRINSRLQRLIASGHSRAETYVTRRMADPIRLATFLRSIGVDRWDVVTKRELAKYFAQYPAWKRREINVFLNFLNSENPFRRKRGTGIKRKKNNDVIRNAPLMDVYSPPVLTQKIRNARSRLDDEPYLLYWLVARFGMTAKAAHRITLERFTVAPTGKLVIRPANGWLEVPQNISEIAERVCKKASTKWPFSDPEDGTGIPVLLHVGSDNHVTRIILEADSLKLRRSAFFAAILQGHFDRTTVREMLGASLPTIEKLEFLLSADLHSVLPPDLVKARNARILGND